MESLIDHFLDFAYGINKEHIHVGDLVQNAYNRNDMFLVVKIYCSDSIRIRYGFTKVDGTWEPAEEDDVREMDTFSRYFAVKSP